MTAADRVLSEHGDAIRAAASQARSLLELFWPMWRESGGIPAPAPGETVSDRCCIHGAMALRDVLARRVPELRWSLAGGVPTDRRPLGGYMPEGASEGVQHCWVHGASHDLPGEPLVLADVTGDQFGEPAVLVCALPRPGYLGNAAPGLLREFERHEAEIVALFDEMARAADHLFAVPRRA